MKNEIEKPQSSDVRVELGSREPVSSPKRAEGLERLRRGLRPYPKEREEAVFQAMFEKMAQTSQFPRRSVQIQVTVEEPIDKAAWVEKEMADIQMELAPQKTRPVLRADDIVTVEPLEPLGALEKQFIAEICTDMATKEGFRADALINRTRELMGWDLGKLDEAYERLNVELEEAEKETTSSTYDLTGLEDRLVTEGQWEWASNEGG